MPLLAHLLLGEEERKHRVLKKIPIETGESFDQNKQISGPLEEIKSEGSVDLSVESGPPKKGEEESHKSEEFTEFVHENEMNPEDD